MSVFLGVECVLWLAIDWLFMLAVISSGLFFCMPVAGSLCLYNESKITSFLLFVSILCSDLFPFCFNLLPSAYGLVFVCRVYKTIFFNLCFLGLPCTWPVLICLALACYSFHLHSSFTFAILEFVTNWGFNWADIIFGYCCDKKVIQYSAISLLLLPYSITGSCNSQEHRRYLVMLWIRLYSTCILWLPCSIVVCIVSALYYVYNSSYPAW